MADYLAKFSNESETFHTLAATWPAPSDRLVPLTWWQVLRKSTDVDIALRIAGGSQSSAGHREAISPLSDASIAGSKHL